MLLRELADEWSYSKLVSIGSVIVTTAGDVDLADVSLFRVIPTNPTQRKYANRE